MFKEAESRPDKIESTSNNVQVRKKQQHRRRACDLLASLKRFYWPNTRIPMCLNFTGQTLGYLGANVHHVPGLCLLGIGGAPYISHKIMAQKRIFTF